jgi:hypothetical protein
VNAVRAAANLSAATSTDPTLTTSATIKAVLVTELRTALDAALTALGISTSAYTNPSLTGIVIKKVHVDEVRHRVK